MEGVDDAPDRAEEADEGRDVRDGSKPGDAGFHEGEGFGRGGKGGTFEAGGVARKAAAVGLAMVFVVDFVEDGDERRGAELLGGRGDLGEAAGFAEGPEEPRGLIARFGEAAELGDDDRPGKDGEQRQQDEDGVGNRAGVVQDFEDGRGRWRGRRRGGGGVSVLEYGEDSGGEGGEEGIGHSRCR